MCPRSEWFHKCESKAKSIIDFEMFLSSFQKNHSILLLRLSLILSKDIGRLSQIALYPDFRAFFKIHILEKYHPTSSKWFFFCIVTITKSSFSHFFALSTISCTGMIYQSAKSKSVLSWKPTFFIHNYMYVIM